MFVYIRLLHRTVYNDYNLNNFFHLAYQYMSCTLIKAAEYIFVSLQMYRAVP